MKVGRLLLRVAVGGFFFGHGTQKLFGWFGGSGIGPTGDHFESIGLRPGKVHAVAAGATEALGGAGLAIGYRTPLASAGLIATMITAINRVHAKNGPWAHTGGYEYNVVLAAAAMSIAESGPGPLSLDRLRGKERQGALWGLFSLGLGAAGAAGAHVIAESRSKGAAPMPAPADAPPGPATPAPAAPSDNGAEVVVVVEEIIIESSEKA